MAPQNEHNELRKKHNEELKPEKVSLPGFSLSLTTKQNKFLTNKECNDIANEVEIDRFRGDVTPHQHNEIMSLTQ